MNQIVIISPSKFYGGGERFLETLCQCYFDHHIFVVAKNKHLIYKLRNFENVTIINNSIFITFYLLYKKKILNKSTHFFINGLGENRKVAFIFKLLKLSPIVICHSIEDWGRKYDKTFTHKFRSKINIFLFSNSKFIVGVSSIAAQNLKINFEPKKVKFIPNTAGNNLYDKVLKTKNNNIVNIGFVSRFSKEKGIERFVRIVEDLINISDNSRRVKFLVAGNGPLLNMIENLKIKYPNNVEYLGFVDSNIVFSKIDVLLITSNTESMPLVALEAMKNSIPLISTSVGGMKDLIKEGFNGYTFPLDNNKLLTDKLNELIHDQGQLDTMGFNGHKLYDEIYNFSHFCKSYNEIIRVN